MVDGLACEGARARLGRRLPRVSTPRFRRLHQSIAWRKKLELQSRAATVGSEPLGLGARVQGSPVQRGRLPAGSGMTVTREKGLRQIEEAASPRAISALFRQAGKRGRQFWLD